MAEKRVIEQPASEEVYNDDWFLKDSPTQETSKINLANLKAAILDGKNVAALSDDIAPEYNPNESYVAGDLAIHNSLLYICLGATTGNWDSTKWDLTSIAELLANLDLSADNISYDNTSSGLEAENVQDAIDEVLETAGKVDDIVSHGQSLVENKISDLSSLSAVGTASGDIATFTDGSALPMPSLKVAIEPVQEGSGEPSPTNVRQISGWDECNVTVADAVDNPTVENVYTIDLDGTRYGGTLDVVSGVLTVTHKKITVDENTDIAIYTGWRFRFNADNFLAPSASDIADIICDKLSTRRKSQMPYGYSISASDTGTTQMLISINESITTVEDMKSWLANNPLQICYILATPQTIQLTPTQVKSLLGQNNVWADTGDILDAEYVRDATTIINEILSRLNA